MPIILNNSNISVTYNTGSNYIIETVKSDVFVKDTRTGISSNLFAEPSVIPSKTPVTTGNPVGRVTVTLNDAGLLVVVEL